MEQEKDEEEESIKRWPLKSKNNATIVTKRKYDVGVTPKDVLDEFIKHSVKEMKAIEDYEKKSALQKELNKVNKLEVKLVGKLQLIQIGED